MERSDEMLVRDVQEGDISAFEHLVKRYQRKLHAFVYTILKDYTEAQDVVQESFISLYKTIDRIDTKRKFSSYLFAIARNHAISCFRSRKSNVSLEIAEVLPSVEQPEFRDDVHAALNAIDKKYTRVLKLYYFENLSYEEISKVLQFPINTIRTHLKRAKEALRKQLM